MLLPLVFALLTMNLNAEPPKKETLVIAGGCFWCVEGVLEQLIGVDSVESGYAGGTTKNPTYKDVCSGETGHAEVVKVTFDPAKITAKDLLRIFFTVHNPTTLNQQGGDYGTQYRSAIFYRTPEEKALAESVIKEVTDAKIWKDKIVTSLEPLTEYYVAEDYHQDYFKKYETASPAERSTMNSGYCQVVIAPKVLEFRKKYASRLKPGG